MSVKAVRSLIKSRKNPALRVATTTPLLQIPLSVYNEMREHAIYDAPRECCGILATRGVEVLSAHRGENTAEDPHKGFQIETENVSFILDQIACAGHHPGAIYHSHPFSLAFPSITDIKLAWPSAITIIMGMGQGFVMRGFEIISGRVREVRLEIV